MNITHALDIKTQSLGGLVLVMLEVHMWSGSKRLKKEALIAKNPEFANLPPQKLATLGGTKICDPKELAPLLNLKREAQKLLQDHGLPFLKGFGIPEHKWDLIYQELQRIKLEFESKTKALYLRFDLAIQNWRDDPENQGWAHLIHDIPTAEYVAGQMSFAYHPIRALSPSADETHESNKTFVAQMTGLKGELFADAAREAEVLATKYLMSEDKLTGVVSRREHITQKTLRPLRRIAEKFESFAFLDPTVEPLSDMIDHVLEILPAEGRIEGVHLVQIWQLAQTLMNPEKAMQIASYAFQVGSPANAFEHLLSGSKKSVSLAAVVPEKTDPVATMECVQHVAEVQPAVAAPVFEEIPSTNNERHEDSLDVVANVGHGIYESNVPNYVGLF